MELNEKRSYHVYQHKIPQQHHRHHQKQQQQLQQQHSHANRADKQSFGLKFFYS